MRPGERWPHTSMLASAGSGKTYTLTTRYLGLVAAGAPVGSVLVGPRDLIARAHRVRKMLGGGMRQAGVLAAAGRFALDEVLPRLADDHAHAEALAEALKEMQAGEVSQATNMVFLTPRNGDARALHAHLAGQGILIGGQSPCIRMVLHRDITDDDLGKIISGCCSYFAA